MIAPGLRVLFCGINPGLYSGAVGHHFARPGNRFWKALHAARFTESVLSPLEERKLLATRLGITNLVGRATSAASELSARELRHGALALARKATRFRPRFIAFLGLEAYRIGFGRRDAEPGLQAERLAGSRIWLLPNPSGLNAHYQLAALAQTFGDLRRAAGA